MNPNEYLLSLQDRTVSGSVWKVIICPQMDLVAVVLDRNSITIYRTNWQRLATIPVCSAQNELITSVAWSPDGANLVVGTSSKILAVYSVDRCASTPPLRAKRGSRDTEPILTRQLCAVPTAILWSATPSTASTNANSKRFAVYENRAEKIHESRSSADSEPCNGLLLVGDADGMMTILTHNLLLSVAHIPAVPQTFAVNHIHLTACQRYCLTSGSNSSPGNEDLEGVIGDTQFVLRAFDLNHVLEYWPELDRLGQEVMNFVSIIDKLSAAVKRVEESWVQGALEVLRCTVKKPLEELMSSFAEEGDNAWQALHDVYCGARIKGAVLQFLANNLSENGAKEALRSFRNHADDTEEIAFSMVPIAENTVFSSSEYRGLARLESRFKPVGMELCEAERLFQLSEMLLLAIGDLVGEMEEVSQEVEAFLAWLVTAAAKAGGESVQPRGPTLADKISGRDAEMVSKFFAKHSHWKVQDTRKAKVTVTALLTDEVKPALEAFKKAVETVVAKPCDVISTKLIPTGEISFSDVSECNMPSTFSNLKPSGDKDDTHYVDIIPSVGNGSFVWVRFDFVTANWTMRRYRLATMGRHVEAAAMLSNSALLAVTSVSQSTDMDDKAACNLTLYELESKDFDVDSMTDDSETTDGRSIPLPNAFELSGKQLDTKSCGSIRQRGEVALSVNVQHGLVCVLAAPRKIFLFQIPNQTLQQDQDMWTV